MKFVIIVLLCHTIASAICADEHRAKMKLKDSERGKRNLEYSISHNYPIGSNFRLERRIASGPSFQLPSRFPPYFPAGPRPYIPSAKRARPHSVPPPPYAVQMEPLVQYSQRDPLYDSNKLPLTADAHNDLSKPDDLLTDNNHLSENIYLQNIHGPSYSHEPVYYQKEPEPIIEIIIKESNVTLPPVPVPTLPPKKKEPVQVFYVKYKKNPNGHGKDSVVYDKPIPALTPHIEEPEPEPQIDYPRHEYVTAAPPPTTTIRTIIRPDSETYIGTSGIRVTFGSEHKKEKPSIDGQEESAPQPAVIFPQNNQQHHQVHQQQQAQFSQPIPERKPLTAAFPPNFNPPGNFNQHTFNPRPSPPFQNNQFRQNHHQSVRQFPNQPNSRPPTASLPPQHRPFQSQQFPPRPLNPPQVPPQSRPPFNQQPQFHQTHQQNSQIPPNHQFSQNSFPPNHQPPQNHAFPPIQFTSHSFQHNFPPSQPQKSQFSQLLNHRSQSHFPVVQQNTPPPHFGQKTQPQLQQQPQKNPQNIQFNQHQQQFRNNQPSQQQQSFQFHHQNHLNIQHQQQVNHHHHQQPVNNPQQPKQQIQQQPQQPQPLGHVIPPGGELLKSVPRFEQHISVPAEPTQLTNSQGIKSETLPQIQNQSPVNLFATSQNVQFSHQPQVTSQSTQLQQFQHEQQQRNLQIQQQLKQQEQILQQQKYLSPQEFQQQIQQQFQQFPQNFAQLSHIQNKQQSQLLSLPQKQENIQIQSSIQPSNHQQLQQSAQQQQLQQSAQEQAQQQHRQQQSQQQQLQQQAQQIHQSQAQNFFLQNLQNQQKSIQEYYQSQNNPSSVVSSSTTQNILYQSTTQPPSTTTIKTEEKSKETKKENKLPANIVLPDEVPDELREQLLSSGILSNADISVLDYDKVGDIPIEALPPDQLANFYGAGGAQQISASERKEIFVKPNGEPINENSKTIFNQELEAEASEVDEVTESAKAKPGVEMKVVHYDSETQEGKAVQDSYVQDDATQVDPVVLNDNKYNRYLPLKVSGVNFPIPDVPELKGRNITSVVVLAPVDYEFQSHEHHSERTVRDIEGDIKDVRLLAGDALKTLIKEPTKENYNKWLERENQTSSDKQSVVLLVTGSPENKEKEIFMYDVATKTVSKLSGELSSAFVEAAESNAEDGSIPEASEIFEEVIKPENTSVDLEAENSDILEEFVDASSALQTADNKISFRSGYSKTG